MNNLKKLGLTALGTTLIASSAFAGTMETVQMLSPRSHFRLCTDRKHMSSIDRTQCGRNACERCHIPERQIQHVLCGSRFSAGAVLATRVAGFPVGFRAVSPLAQESAQYVDFGNEVLVVEIELGNKGN